MSGHTAGPWYQVPTDSRVIVDRDPSRDDARVVAKTHDNRWECRSCDDDAAANAAFIVRACNSHEELLAAGKAALVEIETAINANGLLDADGSRPRLPVEKKLRAAIKRAEGRG